MESDLWLGIIYTAFRVLILGAIIYYSIYEIRRERRR